MLPVLKVVGLGGVCAGALYCTWWMSNGSIEIPFRDLSTDEDFDTASGKPYNNKYAADYAKYFVGVHDKAKGNPKDFNIKNDDWWNWSFENRYLKKDQSTIKDKFKSKLKGSDLKEACKNAYKADKSKVTAEASGADEYKEQEIWVFCSIGGNKPTTISERNGEKDTYGTEKYGGVEANSKLLISVKDENNDWFWDVKEKEFFEMSSYPTDLGETSGKESEFKKLHKEKDKHKSLTHRKVKELCGKAYDTKTAEGSTSHPKQAIFKFCSLKGQAPS